MQCMYVRMYVNEGVRVTMALVIMILRQISNVTDYYIQLAWSEAKLSVCGWTCTLGTEIWC